MRGVIPAAGKAKRLGNICKSLLEVNGKLLIEHPLQNMKDIGVKEVMIIQNGNAISDKLGNEWNGLKISYVQQTERKGIAHAINLAKEFVADDDFIVILGDIVYKGNDLGTMATSFFNLGKDAMAGFKMINDPEEIKKSYGIYDNRFIEKPKDVSKFPNFLGLGIYMFNPKFFTAYRRTQPSETTGEIEITETLNNFEKISPFILNGFYKNVNTEEELKEVRE